MTVALNWFSIHAETLLYILLCFCVGTIAGFQGLVARIPSEYQMGLRTLSGFGYIALRGALPAALYLILHKSHLLNLSSWLEALVLGAGSESLFRSRFLLAFKSPGPGQPAVEDSKGVLDLVFGMQKFFLDRTASQLAKQRRVLVEKFYGIASLAFIPLTQDLDVATGALGPQAAAASAAIAEIRTECQTEKAKAAPGTVFDAAWERRWCLKLGYKLYNTLDRDNFDALSASIKP